MSATGWSLWKTVAYPGRVVVPPERTGDRPLVYNFTRQDLEHTARLCNRKLADGWNIPLCWEHQDVTPDRLRLSEDARKARDFALGVFGKGAGFKVAPDGRLLARLRGRDHADLEQFKDVEFVSPEFQWNWMDTDGKIWRGPTITHIAATPRPVQRYQESVLDALRQNPMKSGAIQLSLTSVSVGARLHPTRLRLSLANYVSKPRGAATMPADIDDKDMDTNTDTEGASDSPSDTDGDGGGKKASWMQRIADAAAGFGLKFGDLAGVKSPDDFATLFETAALNFQGDDGNDEYEDDEEEPGPEGDTAPQGGDMQQMPTGSAPATPPPVQMSLEAQTRQAEQFARNNLVHRISRLRDSGRVTPAIADDLLKRVPKLRLSFTSKGDVTPNDVTIEIAAYERNPPRSAWSRAANRNGGKGKGGKGSVRLSQTRLANRSQHEERSPQDDNAIVDAFESMAGRGKD